MKHLILAAGLLLTPLQAQAPTPKVDITWQDAANPPGTTYAVERGTGKCSDTPAMTRIASGVTAKTYTDSTVTIGGDYCYQVRAVYNSKESAPSNQALADIPAASPTGLKTTVTVNVTVTVTGGQ